MAKSVLLIIGGGIAAYKSLELIRALKKQGVGTRVIMTRFAPREPDAMGNGTAQPHGTPPSARESVPT